MSIFDMYKNEAYQPEEETSNIVFEDGEAIVEKSIIEIDNSRGSGIELFGLEPVSEDPLYSNDQKI